MQAAGYAHAMPSRRDQIRMTGDELEAFLAERKTVTCATLGPNGRPHLMPLWYVAEGVELRCWTFAKSQKAKNLERDPRATLQVEAGVAYEELRGAMLECDTELVRDTAAVAAVGLAILARYAPAGDDDARARLRAAVEQQAPKRVGMRFTPTRIVSWDHRKLRGAY